MKYSDDYRRGLIKGASDNVAWVSIIGAFVIGLIAGILI